MDNNLIQLANEVKNNIQKLINGNKLDEAERLIDDYYRINDNDIDIYSMKSILYIMKNELEQAEEILKKGMAIDENNFDLNYNLAYLYEVKDKEKLSSLYYQRAYDNCKDSKLKSSIKSHVKIVENKKKIVFFVKPGMDSFLDDIINNLSNEYESKKIIVSEYNQIEQGMEWADICWFEWCDDLVAYGSKHELAEKRIIICRLHRYEAFTNYIYNVNWVNIRKVIFVSEHIRDIVVNKIKILSGKSEVVHNGINLDKFKYYSKNKGFNIAYVGYINLRKNPMFVIQCMNELVKIDNRYKLFIAGEFQDESLYYYMKDMVSKLGLCKNIKFDGFIKNENMSQWLKDKNYIVSASIAEGHPVGIMEAMSSGTKPLIHYFPGSEMFYNKKYIYYDIDGFINGVKEEEYNSYEYRQFIEDNYSLNNQMRKIKSIFNRI